MKGPLSGKKRIIFRDIAEVQHEAPKRRKISEEEDQTEKSNQKERKVELPQKIKDPSEGVLKELINRYTPHYVDIIEKINGLSWGNKLLKSSHNILHLFDLFIQKSLSTLTRNFHQTLAHRKYRNCSSDGDLRDLLLLAMKENEGYIHYFFTFLPSYPHYLFIAYNTPRKNIIKEIIEVIIIYIYIYRLPLEGSTFMKSIMITSKN